MAFEIKRKKEALMEFKADRRLYLSLDKKRVVEHGDPDAAQLFATPGSEIRDADAKAYGLDFEAGKVVLPGRKETAVATDDQKSRSKAEDKAASKGEDKAAKKRQWGRDPE